MSTRTKIARELRRVLDKARVNSAVLADAAGIHYGRLRTALSDPERARVEDFVEPLAGALDAKAAEMRTLAQELRALERKT